MPAYFTLGLRFKNNRIKPDLVEKIYSVIISYGFNFKSGYNEEATLDGIIKWNQNLLEHGFILGGNQHHKDSILNREGGNLFIESKVAPIETLALELWDSGIVDAIQTRLELDFYDYDLSEITAGKNISINPFAILSEKAFRKFPKQYFDTYQLTTPNNGIFVRGGEEAVNYFRL